MLYLNQEVSVFVIQTALYFYYSSQYKGMILLVAYMKSENSEGR